MPFRRTSIDSNQRTGFYSPKRSRVVGGGVFKFDADALTYINAVEAADGEALEFNIKTAYNAFVVGCKADGIWNAIKASCILAGARTLPGALVPLVGTAPTNNNFISADYNRETGLVGDGSTKYLDSNRAGNADPQNNFHAFAWLPSQTLVNENVARQLVASVGNTWLGYNTAVLSSSQYFARARQASSSTINFATTNVIGTFGVSRVTSSAITVRANGASTSVSIASTTAGSPNFFVLAANDGSAAVQYSDVRLSFYSIGESLDLALLDNRVTRLVNEIQFFLNTGLDSSGYNINTLKYVNAGYAAGGSLS